MGDVLFLEIAADAFEVETDVILDNMDSGTRPDTTPKVHLEGVETVSGVGGVARFGGQPDSLGMVAGKSIEIVLAQHHTLGSTRGAAGIKQYQRIGAVVCRGILFHELQSFLRIAAVKRQLRKASLDNGKGCQHHLLVAGHGESHHMFSATDGICRVDGIREFIYLCEGEPFVAGHAEDSIRPLGHVLLEALHQCLVRSRLLRGVEAVQPFHLLWQGIFDLLYGFGREHRTEDGTVAGRQFCHECVGIVGAAVAKFK